MGYIDNKGRFIFAKKRASRESALYDPAPADQRKCDRYIYANGMCYNKGIFGTGGTGLFVENNQLKACKECGSSNDIYAFEFKITSRYGGDNYKVYFETADFPSLTYFAKASPIYTAVKHVHIERDKMCRNGGILKEDALAGQSTIYLAMNPDGTRADNINIGNIINIFDSETPYEGVHDIACVKFLQEDTTNKRVRIDLGQESDCNTTYNLANSYYCDHDGSDPDPHKDVWDFTSGNSAGVCKNDNLFFIADTSDLAQPFSDGFVTFHISKDGFAGSNVVPYMPREWNDVENIDNYHNFSKIWFKNFISDTVNPPYPIAHNYFHLIGAGYKTGIFGSTYSPYDFTYIYSQKIEEFCIGNEWDCNRRAVDHEIGHQFWTNACTNLENCDNPGEYLGEHDYRAWWFYTGGDCHSPDRCLMFPTINNPPGTINRFCKEDLILGDPNCPNPTDKENTAIRTTYDPK